MNTLQWGGADMPERHVQLEYRLDSRSNGRGMWQKRARLLKEDRHVGDILWYMFQSGPVPKGKMVVKLTRIGKKALDDDNLRGAFKGIRDGIAERIGIDDSDPRVTWEYAQIYGHKEKYAVRMSVRSV